MSQFRGLIENAFELPQHGVFLMLNKIEGMPKVGMRVHVLEHRCRITALGRNSTDGQAVSTRACLTGLPTDPYGGVCVEWEAEAPAINELHKCWAEEEVAT